jgi:hypothetical protein
MLINKTCYLLKVGLLLTYDKKALGMGTLKLTHLPASLLLTA